LTVRYKHLSLLSFSLLALATFLSLSLLRGYVPLWIEGMTEYQTALSTLLGYRTDPFPCALEIGDRQIPLAVTPYVGGGFIYLHAPFVLAWYRQWVSDPYFFRLVGILAFVGSGALIYFLGLRHWNERAAWWAGVLWLTTPNLFFVAIADLQFELVPVFFALASAALFKIFVDTGRWPWLLGAAFIAGVLVTTRVDAFVLLIISALAYGFLRLGRIRRFLAEHPLPAYIWGLFLFAFVGGALPFFVYNATCESGSVLGFLTDVVVARTFEAGGPSFLERLRLRAGQYLTVDVLHQLPFLNLYAANYLHAGGWAAAGVLLIARIRKGLLSYPLFAIVLLIPVSLLSTGVLRPEHMVVFQPLTVLLVSSALSWDPPASGRWRIIRAGGLALLVAGNLFTLAENWRAWLAQPVTSDAITNQSDPVLLREYLRRFDDRDRIVFTNVGLWNYLQYMTAAGLRSENGVSWGGDADFVQLVENALADRNRRVVFVGCSLERDGSRFNLVRTRLLIDVLQRKSLRYSRTTLSSPRRVNLYEVIVVEPRYGDRSG
jgi:hypothetical protein